MPGMRIAAIAAYAPSDVISNKDVADLLRDEMDRANAEKIKKTGEGLTDDEKDKFKTNDRWIRRYIGFSSRRFASTTQGTTDLAYHPSKTLIDNLGMRPSQIEAIVFGRVTPTYLYSPPDANLLQAMLDIPPYDGDTPRRIFGIDASLACSTWLASLTLTYSLIRSGMFRTVLLIGADKMSVTINWRDRAFATVLGDAGTATLCVAAPDNEDWFGLDRFYTHMDGRHWQAIIAEKGGSRHPITELEDITGFKDKLTMDGPYVKKEIVPLIGGPIMDAALKQVGWRYDQIDLATIHEANLAQLNGPIVDIWKTKGYRGDVLDAGGEFANTTSASVPLALAKNGAKLRPVSTPPKKFVWIGVGGSLTASLAFGEIKHELLTFLEA